MGYYVRVLTPSEQHIRFRELRDAVAAESPKAMLAVDEGSDDHWRQLLLAHPDGTEIAILEHHGADDDLLAEEIQEFRDEIADCKPQSGALWLKDYLQRIRAIYALQVLDGVNAADGWAIFGALKAAIWQRTGGIFQADGEGFSNPEGYHILWQFSETVSGNWWMGVLENGAWVHFEMDLGNPKHREAFLRGEVPKGVARA